MRRGSGLQADLSYLVVRVDDIHDRLDELPQEVARALQEMEEAGPSVEIPPAPEPQRPPQVLDFVGRDEELGYYARRWRLDIWRWSLGCPGVGKTALAVKLAEWVAPEGTASFGTLFMRAMSSP